MSEDVDRTAGKTSSQAKRADRSNGVYLWLYEAILTGEMEAGAKLSEPALAQRLGASRAPVREAIRRLQERGLVTHVANQGVRVVSPSLADYIALLDVREALEGMSARLAAVAMTDPEIEDLVALVDRHGRMFEGDPSAGYVQSDPDADFHVRIARGCRNPILSSLLCDHFYPRLLLCRRLHQGVKGRGLTAWKEHRRISDAISERDSELAEILMRRHVRAAKQALEGFLQGAGDEEDRR